MIGLDQHSNSFCIALHARSCLSVSVGRAYILRAVNFNCGVGISCSTKGWTVVDHAGFCRKVGYEQGEYQFAVLVLATDEIWILSAILISGKSSKG